MDATLMAAMVIVGVSGVIFGMTGFGFALVSVPPLLLIHSPETVVALTIGASMLTSVIVVLGARRELDGRLVLSMLPGACVGLLIGVWVLKVIDPALLKITAGALVAAYSILLLRGYQPSGMRGGWWASTAGAASGALATSTGLSGPPVVILFTARQLATRLKEFGAKPGSIRFGHGVVRGYTFDQFQDAFDRYLSADTPFESATPLQASNHAGLPVADSIPVTATCNPSATLQPSNHAGCSGVADKTPPRPEVEGESLSVGWELTI